MEPRIFAFWFGDAPMNENRLAGLASLRRQSGVEVTLIGDRDIEDWLVPGFPVHPAYEFLTPIHRADYLRTYLMHLHGGGYADIKPTTGSWQASFDRLDGSRRLLGVGYREVGRHGVSHVGVDTSRGRWQLGDPAWWRYRSLQLSSRWLLGNGAYIFRPRSKFTTAWFDELHVRLDQLRADLEQSPGRYAKERGGRTYGGEVSSYPVPWSHLLGDIFHPLCLRFAARLDRGLPRPRFDRYQ